MPAGVHIVAIENSRRSIAGTIPTYVEVDFFGEDDTRSNMVRLVTERFTKIINVPNMKDHGAAGVTGCLKNIAYGDFSNVARSHQHSEDKHAIIHRHAGAVEPLRSKTVLQIMDGLRGVWQGGPFLHDKRYRFYPKQMMFGTDPVAIDRLLLDVVEEKRREEHAISVWYRSSHTFTGVSNATPTPTISCGNQDILSSHRNWVWAYTTNSVFARKRFRSDAVIDGGGAAVASGGPTRARRLRRGARP